MPCWAFEQPYPCIWWEVRLKSVIGRALLPPASLHRDTIGTICFWVVIFLPGVAQTRIKLEDY